MGIDLNWVLISTVVLPCFECENDIWSQWQYRLINILFVPNWQWLQELFYCY